MEERNLKLNSQSFLRSLVIILVKGITFHVVCLELLALNDKPLVMRTPVFTTITMGIGLLQTEHLCTGCGISHSTAPASESEPSPISFP